VHHIILTIDFELGMGNVCFHCDIIRLVASGQKLYMQGMFEFRFILFFLYNYCEYFALCDKCQYKLFFHNLTACHEIIAIVIRNN